MIFGVIGAALGAFAGLLIATLINVNCDPVEELIEDCTRINIWLAMLIGAIAGLFISQIAENLIGRRVPRSDDD
jgi:hypothetical protein